MGKAILKDERGGEEGPKEGHDNGNNWAGKRLMCFHTVVASMHELNNVHCHRSTRL